ncbi:uncharacterized protein LOC126064388 [Elephas maximus indicus]|uniref:uncharacterized protein LOC126064388 n=1 Tax=Elephas maximus indicus TaxID=99487 RepID=UPI0021162C83|nr:uncharacterized protein LOC126064388 [Elephas maximus indicus]
MRESLDFTPTTTRHLCFRTRREKKRPISDKSFLREKGTPSYQTVHLSHPVPPNPPAPPFHQSSAPLPSRGSLRSRSSGAQPLLQAAWRLPLIGGELANDYGPVGGEANGAAGGGVSRVPLAPALGIPVRSVAFPLGQRLTELPPPPPPPLPPPGEGRPPPACAQRLTQPQSRQSANTVVPSSPPPLALPPPRLWLAPPFCPPPPPLGHGPFPARKRRGAALGLTRVLLPPGSAVRRSPGPGPGSAWDKVFRATGG